MKKRLSISILTIFILFYTCEKIIACDEVQTKTYICQVLFGSSALSHSNDDKVKMLNDAIYLCCEQSDGLGQDKVDYLKAKHVFGIPTLHSMDIKSSFLLECSHERWEYEYIPDIKRQKNRKKVLRNTVNKVFDFGLIDNLFGSGKGKCNSFAAMLYYTHLLSDYLADDPEETETNVGGKLLPAYSGQPYITVNGNKPSFMKSERNYNESFTEYSGLDSLGRAGVVFANIGPDTITESKDRNRQDMSRIKPSGWSFNKYPEFVNSEPAYLYNRCHLLAHSLGGVDQEINIVTGTRYMNATGMEIFESQVKKYIETTNNHVLYRATPIFKGDNKLVSGVQLEAFSVEDAGAGLSFNVFCYNVQPGIAINYLNGDNQTSDITYEAKDILPFATYNASENNPDLIYEMNQHFEVLFEDQINSKTFKKMLDSIKPIAVEARAESISERNPATNYINLKTYEYKYLDVLKSYIPLLLRKEDFFMSAFY